MSDLYPHQSRAMEMLRERMRIGSKRVMLQAPTGFGKTKLAGEIVRGALAKGKRVIITVPAISLIDQTVESFMAEGIRDIGVIQASHFMTNSARPVQVASVQTLAIRAKEQGIPRADLVLVDEAHRQFRLFEDWMELWPEIPFIGLSATPWSKGLGRLYQTLITAATTSDLIKAGYLSPFRVYAPTHPDLSGVRVQGGDFHEGDLAKAMNQKRLVADVVTTWLAKAENRPTLCFAVDRAHATHLQARFMEAQVACGYMDANTDDRERAQIRRDFHSGKLKVVVNIGTLTTGVDWDVRCIILARPTKSDILFTQIVGRGLRTAPGKTDCLILDHSDSTMNLGFVTDINYPSMCDGTISRSKSSKAVEALPKECPKCSYLKQPRQLECPSCGFKTAAQPPKAEEGELIELDAARRRKSNKEMTWPEKVAFMGQLKLYAYQTGKKAGWVNHQYKAKTGVWPNDSRVRYAHTAAEISEEMHLWLHSRRIAFAKMKERAGEG